MFKDRLKQARKSRNLTQQNLADALDITLRTYQRYESGDTEPSLVALSQIADILDVTTDYLLCRSVG